jgi:transaldolase
MTEFNGKKENNEMSKYKSPLHEMAETTKTQFWNDSCSVPELVYAMEHGAVGATTNPVIVGQVLQKELQTYVPQINKSIAENPEATEDEIAWMLIEQMAVSGAKLLEPVFKKSGGQCGYISIQINAKNYKIWEKMVEQAVYFKGLAPNIMVKMPVSRAGVRAIEESTYRGVTVNATVSFTTPQALAVAEAVERGLARRTKECLDNSSLHPVCTIMVGRIEDWLKDVMNAEGIVVDPNAISMSGVAVFKRAYKIFMEKGYRTRLLAAAFRNHFHWSEFIGGDVSLTIPHKWIKNFVNSDITVEPRMDNEVDARLLGQLQKHFKDFNRAYEPDGMKPEEFDGFGATKKTLDQFLKGYNDMVAVMRGFMLESR